jgi:hypothetical protein
MNREPNTNYVYQPLPPKADIPTDEQKIYAVGGPDALAKHYAMTKTEAEQTAQSLNCRNSRFE